MILSEIFTSCGKVTSIAPTVNPFLFTLPQIICSEIAGEGKSDFLGLSGREMYRRSSFLLPLFSSLLRYFITSLLRASFSRQMSHQFSQLSAHRQHLPHVFRRKIGSRLRRREPFSAHLHHAHHFPLAQYRRADDLLDRFPRGRRRLHPFKYRCVPHRRKIVVDLRPVIAHRPRRQRRSARQGNEPHVLQRLRHQKVQVPPSRRNPQDRHLVRLHSQALRDLFRHRRQWDFRARQMLAFQRLGQSLQFAHETRAHRKISCPSAGGFEGTCLAFSVNFPSSSTLSSVSATPVSSPRVQFVSRFSAIFRAFCVSVSGHPPRPHESPLFPSSNFQFLVSPFSFRSFQRATCHPFANSLYWRGCDPIACLRLCSTKMFWDSRGGEGMSLTATRPDESPLLGKHLPIRIYLKYYGRIGKP